VTLEIWDTAVQERFRSISKTYFRSAVGAIVVFSLTSLESFDALTQQISDLPKEAVPNARILLVGNKADLESEREVGSDAIARFAEAHGFECTETSALTGKNVSEVFARMSLELSTLIRTGGIIAPAFVRVAEVTGAGTDGKAKRCCH
jgi:small GTP-binding protein